MSTDMTIRNWDDTTTYTVRNVNLDSYAMESAYADDQMIPKGTKFAIVGTGLMDFESWLTVDNYLSATGTRVKYVRMGQPNSPSDYLIDLVNTNSDIGGPFIRMTGTQVIGTKVVLVRFEITDQIAICDAPVTSHVWTQSMSVDAAGYLIRTSRGTMTISRGSSASTNQLPTRDSTQYMQTLPWADLFRFAIVPQPMNNYGWRRESQEFAFDIHNTALTYTVVDRQHAHDLPDGAAIGNMEFAYERSLDNPAIANISFSCDLEGDAALRNLEYNSGAGATTGNRRLIEAAVALSKARINATYGNILVTRMKVTERNMLSQYAIRFELDAQALPQSSAGASTMSPLAYMVGMGYKVIRSTARTMGPYGSGVRDLVAGAPNDQASLYAMLPHYLGNLINGMSCDGTDEGLPYAVTQSYSVEPPSVGAISVALIVNANGLSASNGEMIGAYSDGMSQEPNAGGFTTVVTHNLSVTKVSTNLGMVRLSPMYRSAPDLVFQTRKPEVRVSERIEVSRVNVAPSRIVRPLPTGAYVVGEDWNVSFGRFDSSGNRMFTGVFERTYALYDVGGDPSAGTTTANGFYNFTGVAGPLAGYVVRGWRAPNGCVSPTISFLGTTASQGTANSVFALTATATQRYTVAGENPAT